jgi:hypothetical protein
VPDRLSATLEDSDRVAAMSDASNDASLDAVTLAVFAMSEVAVAGVAVRTAATVFT